MTKEGTLHFILTLMLLMLTVVLLLLPEGILSYVKLFCPVLFFAILTGMLANPVYGFFTGLLAPVIVWALRGDAEFLPDVLPVMISCAAAGVMAGICYRLFLFSFGASFSAVILCFITFGIVKAAVCLILRMSYKFSDYLNDVVVSIWPGLLLCIFLVPILCALLRKTGGLHALHRNWDLNR